MIKVNGVSKTYNKHKHNANTVLQNTSIQLPDTGFVFFVGRSGSGKSTILNAIGGLISYEGEILFNNEKVEIEKYRQRNIGYVFQNFLLFEKESILDNIRIPLNLIGIYDEDEIRSRTATLLKAVDLDVNVKRRVHALSLGQKQRVAIARALASNPQIILADEPTGNLDSKNSIIVMNILKKLSVNHLVICVTHNLGIVNKYADHIYEIKNKQLVGLNKDEAKEINEANITQNINVAKMTKKEFASGDFLVKLFSQDRGENQKQSEIQIIRKEGKILVVGDNISIASNEEIELEDATESNTSVEELDEALAQSSSKDAIDLNFENIKNKKTFKDWYIYKSFISFFRKNTRNFKSFLLSFSNALFPIVIFILFSLMIGQINVLTNESPLEYHENFVTLSNRESNGSMLTPNDLANIMSDPESHIVGTRKVDQIMQYSGDSGWDMQYYLDLENFSFLDNIISNISCDNNVNLTFNISDNQQYSSFDIADQLNEYNLADNELLIDRSLIDQIDKKLNNPTFIYQESIDDAILNSQISINMTAVDNKFIPVKYKIVGIVDTDYPSFYTNRSTNYQMSYYLRNNLYIKYSFSVSDLPKFFGSFFDDISFKEFNDVKNDPNYLFVGPDENEYEWSNEELPLPRIILSKSLMNSLPLSGDFLSNFSILQNGYIDDNTDSESKTFFFYDFNQDDTDYDSSLFALFNLMSLTSKQYNLPTYPSNIKMVEGNLPSQSGDLILPFSEKKLFPDEVFNDDSFQISYLPKNEFKITGFYDDSALESKSPYTSPTTYLASKLTEMNLDYYESPAELLDGPTYILSDDVEATIDYFAQNTSYPYKCYSYDKLYTEYNSNALNDLLFSFVQAIIIILVIFLVITILSNISFVNKNKYNYGILRCLGFSKWKIIAQNSSDILVSLFYHAIIPCGVISILMGLFHVYTLGTIWSLVFFVGYIIIMLFTSNLPLLLLLRKKPVEIINSLN
ncbi:MAG: ATP-binding cassette domain-containing protein [Bacilli bacterium]|nr:ATP-binding cassette domain-containing protein [Bacilli bacterium]